MRDDKRPEDATTPDDIVHLYNKQTRKVVVGERSAAAGAAAGHGSRTAAGGANEGEAQGGRESEDGSEEGGLLVEDEGESSEREKQDGR